MNLKDEILLTTFSEVDYIKAITANKPRIALMELEKDEAESLRDEIFNIKTKIKSLVFGILEQPIQKGGEMVVTTSGGQTRRETIKDVKITEVEPKETIVVTTEKGKYELKIERNEAERMSLKFLRNGYLDYDDPIPNGFFALSARNDQSVFLTSENTLYIDPHVGRAILLDSRKDKKLENMIREAKQRILLQPNDFERALTLAQYVNEVLSNNNEEQLSPSEDRYAKDDKRVATNHTMHKPNGDFVPIGEYKIGVCIHKSLLFKYLADRVGIKCRLVDGFLFDDNERARRYRLKTDGTKPPIMTPGMRKKEGGYHVWNVVEVNGKNYLLDIHNAPNKLIREEAAETGTYARMSGNGNMAGIGGHSVMFRREDIDKD
ncbi:MAG: hypothetical protein US89_C0016G0024 [Candidatus Peregrinibacteria bacterium GW2011_GWF2_38_29]|nr:MAG: hypothetical protein US89_C0016G0024 [Candidatus Peregrinibacteria bacterium GW2011_GWF2_38_29]HBB03137.1 hypothetical protein [Candidatus Peregrinibacteria bacterium]